MGVTLGTAVGEILKRYGAAVQTQVDIQARESAKIGARTLELNSPSRSGKYKASWTYRREQFGHYVIFNEKHYRLTHLLENGHATIKKHGRFGSLSRTRSIPHIAPTEKQVIELFEARLKAAIEQEQ